MAWNRSTLTQSIERATGWISGAIPGATTTLRHSFLNVLARVIGAAMNSIEGLLYSEKQNLFTLTKDEDALRAEAAEYGISPRAGTISRGEVTITGIIGSTIIEGELLQRIDGELFAFDEEVVLSATSQTAVVSAINEGTLGNTPEATELSFIVPIIGVNSNAIVAPGGLVGGTAEEDLESLRARLLLRKRTPPRGGSKADYLSWAFGQDGVTRAWVVPDHLGDGTVGVAFVYDGRETIIPISGDVTAMQAVLDENRPVTATPIAFAPSAKLLNLNIALTPNTAAVKDAVTAELKDLLRREGQLGQTLLISKIREAISIAAGEENYVMSSPSADITHTAIQLPVLGAITWS